MWDSPVTKWQCRTTVTLHGSVGQPCHKVTVSDSPATKWQCRTALPQSGSVGQPSHYMAVSDSPATKWQCRTALPQSGSVGQPCHKVAVSDNRHTTWQCRTALPQSGSVGQPCHKVTVSDNPATKWQCRTALPQSDSVGQPCHKVAVSDDGWRAADRARKECGEEGRVGIALQRLRELCYWQTALSPYRGPLYRQASCFHLLPAPVCPLQTPLHTGSDWRANCEFSCVSLCVKVHLEIVMSTFPCQKPGVMELVLGPIGPASVCCWMRGLICIVYLSGAARHIVLAVLAPKYWRYM